MTIERRDKGNGKQLVVTTACGLCGLSLRPRQGMADHLPNCPVRELYAEIGVLRDGGPDPEEIQAAIQVHRDDQDTDTELGRGLVADGGWITTSETWWCPECQRRRVNCAHLEDGEQP